MMMERRRRGTSISTLGFALFAIIVSRDVAGRYALGI